MGMPYRGATMNLSLARLGLIVGLMKLMGLLLEPPNIGKTKFFPVIPVAAPRLKCGATVFNVIL